MLKGPGQARLETPPRQGPVQSQCPHRVDTPAPIAGVPNAGEHRCGCLKPPPAWVLQSRAKYGEMPCPSRQGWRLQPRSGGTCAPDVLLPTRHQCSLVTFSLCVGQTQPGAPSLAKPFAKGLPRPFTAPQPSQGLDKLRDKGLPTSCHFGRSLFPVQQPLLRAQHPPCPGWR